MSVQKDWQASRRPGFASRCGRGFSSIVLVIFGCATISAAQTAKDPGVRPGSPGAGGQVGPLTSEQASELPDFTASFNRVNTVVVSPGVRGGGLGPRFNSNSCASCHAQPAIGGSSPASNPLFSVYQLSGATNTMPSFITSSGPVLNARFPFQSDLRTPDGQIRQLFTIAGRSDAVGCNIAQPDFVTAATQNNLVFRQPIPLYGDGMIDQIQDTDIIANQNSNTTWKQTLGITGHPNISPADGNIKRFGWKAQIKSLKLMAALEEQIQQGVTNEFFPNELDETAGCVFNGVPEDGSNYDITTSSVPGRDAFTGDAQRAALWVRFLAQPVPAVQLGTTNGQAQFNAIGCGLCHTQSFVTSTSTILNNNITVNLFSDLLVHHMGACLADNIVQGSALGDEFRTAPLWGAGKRIFFLHDGRTTDIVQAIENHFCAPSGAYGPSEANAVINAFNALSASDQQDLVSFVRNL